MAARAAQPALYVVCVYVFKCISIYICIYICVLCVCVCTYLCISLYIYICIYITAARAAQPAIYVVCVCI